jgi:hypothetical protein
MFGRKNYAEFEDTGYFWTLSGRFHSVVPARETRRRLTQLAQLAASLYLRIAEYPISILTLQLRNDFP